MEGGHFTAAAPFQVVNEEDGDLDQLEAKASMLLEVKNELINIRDYLQEDLQEQIVQKDITGLKYQLTRAEEFNDGLKNEMLN
jgi:hypothetical protein